jgi:hypothetical protein
VKQDAHDDGVRLMLRTDFRPEKLSERELEALRAILPQIMLELIQSGGVDENEEE